ncbi:MAG: VWA domain-containing protein, partial [Armatimonadetes bacterium]|nr:VWA domain-containing protein [Armatimonadota bacterium]
MLRVQFTHPWALLCLAALVPVVWLARHSLAGLGTRRARLALALRLFILIALVLALAGLQLVRRVRGTSVVYLLDRSDSIPDQDRRDALDFVRKAGPSMRPDDTAGVVAVGRYALVERAPVAKLAIERVESAPDGTFTDLSAGIRLAVATLAPDAQRRVVVLSDGNENLGDAVGEARLAKALDIPIDVVPLARGLRGEVVAERLVLPGEARVGETIEPRAVVATDQPGHARVRLLEDNRLAAEIPAELTPGKNVVAFPPLGLERDGFHTYTAEVAAAGDHDGRNNRAVGFCFVRGRSRVLYVEGDRGQETYLRDTLERAGIDVRAVGPQGIPADLPALAAYDSLILSNISALDLSDAQMVMIRSAVRDLGMGFVMIGGDESFGVGGYYKTPVEEALPVDMDIRKQRNLPSVGVAIVIDKSGSMAMTEAGVEKIRLAGEGAVAALSVLSAKDKIAVMAVDSVPKMLTKGLVPCTDKQAMIDEITSLRGGGGGIYCHAGLAKADELIRNSDMRLKHVILFADAADSEEQEGCRELVADMFAHRITTTVVGLGHETDCDAKFLKDVARLGHGRFYLTARASNLPRIFTREAILASRSQLIEKPFTPLLQSDVEILRGIATLPRLRGYVATTAKPRAEVGLIADTRFKDPILAAWQYGLGRSVAFTSDCKARWGVDWVAWSGYPKFWSQLVRWTMRRVQRGDFETRVVARLQADADEVAAYHLKRGEARVIVDAVDQQGRFVNFLELHGTTVAPDGTALDLKLRQTAPGRYEATFATEQVGVYLVNVGGGSGQDAGSQTVGVGMAYPPEYGDIHSHEGLLQRVAETSGGRVLEKPEDVFAPRARTSRAPSDVWALLLALALALFPLDVAVRRVVLAPGRLRALIFARRRSEAAE